MVLAKGWNTMVAAISMKGTGNAANTASNPGSRRLSAPGGRVLIGAWPA